REQGQEGYFGRAMVNIAFDLPTIYGHDSDDPVAEGEVGKCGVAIDSLLDMEALLDGFDLQQTFTSMVITGPSIALLAMYIDCAERHGEPIEKLSGVMQNDPLKAYIASKFYVFPPRKAVRIITDMLNFATGKMPSWNTMGISGYHMREAGATPVQELAFTLANAVAYVEAAISIGLGVDDFAPRLSFFLEVGSSFFEEIAKLRAARRMWARLMKEKYGAKNPRSLMMRYHVQTAGSSLTAQQPENNIIRTTVQALAAVLGGTQSLHANSMDEALGLPSEKAVTIALRTQQILAHETGVADTADPLAGSYYVESLTNEIEAQATAYLEQIMARGEGSMLEGVLRGIESGYFQQQLADAASKHQKEVESGTRTVVGVNKFVSDEPVSVELFGQDPSVAARQIAKLKKLRAERDNAGVAAALSRLRQAAQGSENLVPVTVEAVKAYATLGEIIGVLKNVLGEYQEVCLY
ncbi:MAG: methylmalonyl-CoA mutase family protein, partial [Dehalococcoidia bacterium]|nr:methylmalonyl-CoA mutase family protein [Dehalococcoidia bacterium]